MTSEPTSLFEFRVEVRNPRGEWQIWSQPDGGYEAREELQLLRSDYPHLTWRLVRRSVTEEVLDA